MEHLFVSRKAERIVVALAMLCACSATGSAEHAADAGAGHGKDAAKPDSASASDTRQDGLKTPDSNDSDLLLAAEDLANLEKDAGIRARDTALAEAGVAVDGGGSLVTDPGGSPAPVKTDLAANAPVTATLYADSIAYLLAPEFVGQNYEAYPGWGADISMSTFQKQAFSAAGLGMLRYPGGEPGHWSDLRFTGTCKDGSAANWGAPVWSSLWSAFSPGGLKSLMIQTNPTPQYCGAGDQDSSGAHAAALAKTAAQSGIPVIHEVGNEPDISYFNTHGGLAAYAAKFVEHAKAIHAAVPDAKVYGPAVCGLGGNCTFPVTWDQFYIRDFLAATGNKAEGDGAGTVDGISFHVYLHSEWNYSDLAEAGVDLYGFAQYWPWTLMPYLRKQIAQYDTRALPVAISEVSVGTANDANGNGAMSAVLRTLDLIGAFAFSGVHSFQWFDANAAGPSDFWMITKTAVRPTFYSFVAWAQMGDRMLNFESTANPQRLAVYGTSKTDGSVQVLLINKTATAHVVTLKFRGFVPAGKAMRLTIIKSSDGSDIASSIVYNGVSGPEPTALPPPTSSTATTAPEVTVPAYAIVVVEIGP
jgi:hypothetical protein